MAPPPPPTSPFAAAVAGTDGAAALTQPLLGQQQQQGHRQPSRSRGLAPQPSGDAGESDGESADGGALPANSAQAGQAGCVLANLLNSGIGSSTVAMPMVARTLGAGVTLGAMAVQAGLGIAANHILSKEGARSDSDSYADLMSSRYGRWGGRAVAAAQVVNSLGKVVVWLIILADLIVGSSKGGGLLPELLEAAGHPAPEGAWFLRRWPWIVALALLAVPVVSVRSLDKLSCISFVGDGAVALMMASGLGLAVVAVRAGEAHAIRWLPSREEAGAPSRGAFLLEVVSSVPVLMGAAFTQNNIHGAMHQLRPYRQGLLDAAQALARALTVAVFLAIGLSNYAIFGPDLQPDVLLNYSAAGLKPVLGGRRRAALALSAAVKSAFLVNGLVGLPMYLWPAQRNVWSALPRQSPEQRMGERRSFALTNIGSLAGCTLVAVLVPSIWKPLKLLGRTAVSFMAFVAPGLIAVSSKDRAAAVGRGAWALCGLLVSVGLL